MPINAVGGDVVVGVGEAESDGVDGFPGLVVLDADGRLIDEFAGFRSAEVMLSRLRSARGG